MLNKICLVSILMVCISCNKEPDIKPDAKYFRSIAYNLFPFWTINGVYPIASDEVEGASYYYRFDYDLEGRIAEVGFYKNHKIFNGVSQHYGNPGSPVIKISYSNNLEVRKYYDAFGNNVVGRWGSYQDVYSLDNQGRRVGLEFKNQEGESFEAFNGIHRYEWSWLSDSEVVERRYNLSNEVIPSDPEWSFGLVLYQINERGQYIQINNVGQNGKELINNKSNVASIRLNYNEQFQELGAIFLNSNNERVVIGVGSGAIEIAQSRGVFDSLGRYIHERYMDLEDNLTPFQPYSFSQRKMKYDRFDNRVLVYYLDENDNVVDGLGRGYYYQKEIVNENGYKVKTQFLDQDSILVNRVDTKVAEISYSYDSLNRLIQEVYLDENSQPTNNQLTGIYQNQYIYEGNQSNIPKDTVTTTIN